MEDMASTTTLAERLSQLQNCTEEHRQLEVQRMRTRFGFEAVRIALFKYHFVPTIQTTAETPMDLADAAEEADARYTKLSSGLKTYWKQRTMTLINGDWSSLQPETLDEGLAIEASEILTDIETPNAATDLMLMDIPNHTIGVARKLTTGNARSNSISHGQGYLQSHSPDTANTTSSSLDRVKVADFIRQALLKHHAKAAIQRSQDAMNSVEELHFLLEETWSHLPVHERLFWSFRTVQFLSELNRGEIAAMTHFNTSESSALSSSYVYRCAEPLPQTCITSAPIARSTLRFETLL